VRVESAFRWLRLDRVLEGHKHREGGADLLNHWPHIRRLRRCPRDERAAGAEEPLWHRERVPASADGGPRRRGYREGVAGEVSLHQTIHYVRVQTPSRLLSFPWESAQEFLAHCLAAYPTVHPLVEQFRAVGVSRPVDLTDPGDRDFALAVIDAWTAQAGDENLPPGIAELRDTLREEPD